MGNVTERDSPRSIGEVALRCLLWSLGVSLGVGLGAWLTVVSGSGAPGSDSLRFGDVVGVPLLSGLAFFVLSFAGWILLRAVIDHLGAAPRDDSYHGKEHGQNHRVER